VDKAIRVTRMEAFLDDFIHLHVDDLTIFGDGCTEVIVLKQTYSLKEHKRSK